MSEQKPGSRYASFENQKPSFHDGKQIGLPTEIAERNKAAELSYILSQKSSDGLSLEESGHWDGRDAELEASKKRQTSLLRRIGQKAGQFLEKVGS